MNKDNEMKIDKVIDWPVKIEIVILWILAAKNVLLSASGWDIILGVFLLAILTAFLFFVYLMTLYTVQKFCDYIYVKNTIFRFILASILPAFVFIFLVYVSSGEIPALFDPRFLN